MSRPKHRKLAIIGNGDFPITPEVGAEIVEIIRSYGENVILLTRGRGSVDQFIAGVAPIIGLRCFLYPSRGGADNWNRDVELASDADEILAFFHPDALPDYSSGTAHLVEKALDKKRKVHAYSVTDRHLVYAGSSD